MKKQNKAPQYDEDDMLNYVPAKDRAKVKSKVPKKKPKKMRNN